MPASKRFTEFSLEQQLQLTQGVMSCLDMWQLSNSQLKQILGLNTLVSKKYFVAFRNGTKAFPESQDLLARIEHIIGIADALRTSYPFSEQMQIVWLHRAHRRFSQRTPLEVILADSTPNGLLKVRMEVDCNYAYAISEALNNQTT